MNNLKSDYPAWICSVCAEVNGGSWTKGHIATFHSNICGWCKKKKDICSPRNWGYPKFNQIVK